MNYQQSFTSCMHTKTCLPEGPHRLRSHCYLIDMRLNFLSVGVKVMIFSEVRNQGKMCFADSPLWINCEQKILKCNIRVE